MVGKVILDGHLSSGLCAMLGRRFADFEFVSLRALGLKEATDYTIFSYAKNENCMILTKDKDFLRLHNEFGNPPFIVFIPFGNRRNAGMFDLLEKVLPSAFEEIEKSRLVIL